MDSSSRRFTESLEVELTSEEIEERSKENNSRVVERADLQAELESIRKQYRNRIRTLGDEIEKTARVLKDGKESRPVECEWRPNWASYEMKAVRLDTLEVIRVRPMTVQERQQDLYFDNKSLAAGAGAEARADEWTAERCDECGRIEGGHSPDCSRRPNKDGDSLKQCPIRR